MEGQDISEMSEQYLSYPSKNVVIHKGVPYTRPGITNDGNVPTGNKKIIGERVWKDALGGEKAIRVTADGRVQVKWKGVWITIYSGISGDAVRVRFDTWIDDSGAIIKKRIFFVDGTDAIYEWNGAIATIASVDVPGHAITFSENKTGLRLGFDDGSGAAVPVQVVRFTGGIAQSPDVYTSDSDMSGQTIHTVEAITGSPAIGDLIMGQVIKHADILEGINKDDIYVYKNHIAVANLASITVYFSDAENKLDFVIPDSGSRTALSAFLINLDQNYTAMIARFDASIKDTVLWISSVDDWIKVIALTAADSNNEWTSIQQVFETERTGAVPFCVAQQKGDIIFLCQDGTFQRIETIDVLSKDTLTLVSDEVENLLARLDKTEARVYYLKRYIYAVYPAEALVVAFDVIEGHWQTPWTLPVQLMSVIDGILYGHSNARDETFSMLTGTSDLGTDIESVFAFPYYQGFQLHRGTKTYPQDLTLKQKNKTGISGRMTPTTKVLVQEFFETDGSKAQEPWIIDGSKVKLYSLPDDESWATHEWGDASIGGSDDPATPLQRVFAFRQYDAISWFEFRLILTATGKDQQFYLLAWIIDDSLSDVIIPDELYIER